VRDPDLGFMNLRKQVGCGSKEETMTVRIYIRHDVTDYAAWRKTYDAFDAKRRKMGVTGQAVYRSIDDENDVTVTHDFTNAEKAKAFASSPDLKAAMENAGVKGAPQIWFTTRAEQRRRQR
jgi:quinol monooxygenase YgiN